MFAKRLSMVVLVAGMGLPLMMGQGCPGTPDQIPGSGTGGGTGGGNQNGAGPGNGQGGGQVQAAQPTTLLTNTSTSIAGGWIFVGTFNPTSAGKVISVSVAGNTTGSRPRVTVYDASFNVVAQQLVPVTNTTTLTFTSSSTGDHHIYAWENGAPASLYTITAVQQP
jgi:hypothetical protein